jgi:acyl transferase domain-containing protein/thioesterase domain-containing protein/NADP-dependent 3-hydroxy acid dehydrogenase YdfG
VRSAQSEYPGRIGLIDSDGSEASEQVLGRALALDEEPQLALREGGAYLPRVVRGTEPGESRPLDPTRTTLITGGLGGLGALLARHLVGAHSARNLLLVSRRGEEAPGAAELRQELESQGAEVRIAACDVSDRAQLEALLDSIPAEHPLGAVFHCAGVLDDGVLASQDEERLARAMGPKADAAWHLHELTEGIELSHFLCFSSVAGVLGGAAQANYAAANAFLDALAQRRAAEGLAGTSLAWGLWASAEQAAAMGLDDAGASRFAQLIRDRLGLRPMPPEQGLALFDASLEAGEALLVPAAFDRAALRAQARRGALPSVLRELVPASASRSGQGGALAARLADVPESQRDALVAHLVHSEVASVLGHTSPGEVDPGTSFKDLGFDSLAAVELRNRLAGATGLELPATLVFDHPNVNALAGFLRDEVEGQRPAITATATATVRASDEPIAIVGMGCRYPGGIGSPKELWGFLEQGGDAISGFPTDRGWDLDRLFDEDPDGHGTSYVREGGFLEGATRFDPAFFGISPREALAMDPQQRVMLEVAWEALEAAGLDPEAMRGTTTGVFAGVNASDYGLGLAGHPEVEAYIGTGLSLSVASGRIAYALGLEGPAISVDTACSSSLVALHLAAQSLREGDCEMALAGGATVMSTPNVFVFSSRLQALAPDARSKSFAEAADGVAFSEGAGFLVLERLSDAERHGHSVLALVRGSAINQDGASNGLAAPSGPAQAAVIRQALANAGLEPADVDAVEAHGTGTPLGDPIEAGALLATYGGKRDAPLRLGSIKSNIGHSQAAAGVAGLIKMTLALREEKLPKTLHVDAPSSRIEWGKGSIELLTAAADWRAGDRPRRAGVSSFGMSGTNAHVILEEAPPPAAADANNDLARQAPLPGGIVPLPISAKTTAAVRRAAARVAAAMEDEPELAPLDVARTLATGRAGMRRRGVVLSRDRDEAIARLRLLAEGQADDDVVVGRAAPSGGGTAFLFPGYGAQWDGMAIGLLESCQFFAARIRACSEALEPFLGWPLEDALRGAEGAPALDRPEIVQPALFAMMVSLAETWRELGIDPDVVLGHSQGEISAAYVAGGLSLDDAARVLVLRNRALVKLTGKGAIGSVALSALEVEERLEPWRHSLGIAAINGPGATVVSGEVGPLDEFLAGCERDGIAARRVKDAPVASHSAQVEAVREEMLEALAPISPRSGSIEFHSTVTGEPIDTAELGPEYWYLNARETVRLEPVVRAVLSGGTRTLIEVGPHPLLSLGIQEIIDDANGDGNVALVPTLRRGEGGPERFARSLAQAQSSGAAIEWERLFAGTGAQMVALPTYPFESKRYWLHSAAATAVASTPVGDEALDEDADRVASPPEGIAAVPEAERETHLLELVRGQVAAVLGYSSGTEIEPDAIFQELGFDSVAVTDLRNRLDRATGVPIAIRDLIDSPTPQGVARCLLSRLAGTGEGGGVVAPATGDGGSVFVEMLGRARERDEMDGFVDLLSSAARFRPAFESAAGADGLPRALHLAEGERGPAIVLIPSAGPTSGPHEYVRIAKHLADRTVAAVPLPGFRRDEPLPTQLTALAETQAEAIAAAGIVEPMILAGHSSGGWLAHALAEHLEAQGIEPAAVVLLDTYPARDARLRQMIAKVLAAVDATDPETAVVDDARLTAMAAYWQLLVGWEPAPIVAPTLMVRASSPAWEVTDEEGDWRAWWEVSHTCVDVPGNHFSMMSEHAESTAEAVEKELDVLFNKVQTGGFVK